MKLSMTTFGLDICFGEWEAVRMLAESGFDAVDLSLSAMLNDDHPYNGKDYLSKAKQLRNYGESLGISFNQTHSLYPVYKQDDYTFNTSTFRKMLNTIEVSAAIGAKHIVVHPFSVDYGSEWNRNLDYFGTLEPYLRDAGIKIALENTFRYVPARKKKNIAISGINLIETEDVIPRKSMERIGGQSRSLLAMLEALDERCYAACLDVGHSLLVHEEPEDAIRILGNRLESLHIHDNDGVTDLHAIPYDRTGCINWDAVTAALKETGYRGDFTMEACNYLLCFPDALKMDALRLLERTGRYLMERIG